MCNQHRGHRGRSRKGQSTVEYIVLVTAVLSVAILFMTNKDTGFQKKLNSTLEEVTGQMENMSSRLTGSTASQNGASTSPGFTTDVSANRL